MIATHVQAKPLAMWPAVWRLLRLRLRIFISGFKRAKLSGKIGTIILGLFFLAVLPFLFFISWLILRFLNSAEVSQVLGDTTMVVESVPVLMVGAAFIGILLTSFGVLLQALYLAGDMDFLVSAPVPIRAVFFTKMLQAILPNFALITLFSVPVLFGLGISGGYNILYYPLALVVLAALALAAAGLGSLLVMIVVRVFPARRVAEILGLMGALFSFVCSQTGNLARFEDISGDQAVQVFQTLTRFNTPWSPLAWAGRGLVDVGTGNWLTGFAYLSVSLGLAFGLFALALVTAERLYYTGWANVQVGRHKKHVRRDAGSERRFPGTALAERLIPAPVRAVLVKDFYIMRRDIRNMSQLIMPLVFGIVYAFMLFRAGGDVDLPAGRGQAPEVFMQIFKNITLYGNVGLSLFVSWMLVARLGTTGFSQEGKSYWMVKSAPLNANQLLLAKFLAAYLPSLALGELFLVGISIFQRPSLVIFLFSFGVVALSIAGNAGLNLAFGVVGANFNWEDPRKMMGGSLGCLGSLVGFIYLGLSLLFYFTPAIVLDLLGAPQWIGLAAGLLLGGLLSVVGAVLPLGLVRQRVPMLMDANG